MRLILGLSFATVVLVVASCTDQVNPSREAPPIDIPDGGDEAEAGGGGDGSVVTGDPTKGILIDGTILGENGPYEGQVLTLPTGIIACAEPGKACEADPAAAGVAKVLVDGIVAPGLIDTHNHILFDIFDDSDWLPKQKYANHDDWTKDSNEPRYTVMVDVKQCLEDASQGKPVWCPTKYDGAGTLKCEMEKWGELKALVDEKAAVIARWQAEGRLQPMPPHPLILSVWALTQHYADFDVQVRAVLGDGHDPWAEAQGFLEELFARLLKV